MAQSLPRSTAHAFASAVLLLSAACGEGGLVLRVDRLEPASGQRGESLQLDIHGRFDVGVQVSYVDAHDSGVDNTFRAWLGATPLQQVTFREPTRLTAVVAGDLASGRYDLTVEGPAGDRAELARAFEVADAVGCPGGFLYRRTLTIDAAVVSSACAADLADFPALISIENDPALRCMTEGGHVAFCDGRDILFASDSSGAPLDYDLEVYDGVAGTLRAWVRLPSLSLIGGAQLALCYGNSAVTEAGERPNDVWDEGFQAVWHLVAQSGGVDVLRDSTANGNHGTDSGGPTFNVPSPLGRAVDFDGVDDYATISTAGFDAAAGTVEAWVRFDSFPSPTERYAYVFAHCINPETTKSDRIYIKVFANERWGTGMGDDINLVQGSALTTGTWYHLAITWDGTTVTGYLNGAPDFGPTPYSALASLDAVAHVMTWNAILQSERADGTLDELRVSDLPRSHCWLDTGVRNQGAPQTYVVIDAEEAL